jgi:succinate dehydrogenase / fumarate reductase, cytochrome b subunit
MNWFIQTFTSTLGRKVLMSLTGLFLCLFLVVHLIGNLQLLKADGGLAFNTYAQFMGHNPLIQTISIGNFAFILLHILQSILLTLRNRAARPVQYAYENKSSTWSSRNMGILGTVLFVFLAVHLSGFWWRMKFGEVPMMASNPDLKDLYLITTEAFGQPLIVIFYVLSMVMLGFHLSHGFASAFQSLGFNHPKYTPIINGVGQFFSIAVPAAYATIPVVMYLWH